MKNSYLKEIDKNIKTLERSKKKLIKLKPKTLYTWTDSFGSFIGYFNKKETSLFCIRMILIGALIKKRYKNSSYPSSILSRGYENVHILSLKEVPKEDLPLYINWNTTKKFKEFFK